MAASLIAVWEVTSPRRILTVSKRIRWVSNWLLSVLSSLVLKLVFPVMAVGVALLAQEHQWGLFNLLRPLRR